MPVLKREMIWIDLETTGLDARECIPLELGLVVTDKEGGMIDEFKTLVWEDDRDWAIKMGLGAADKIVGPMHQESCLWDDLLDARTDIENYCTREQAEVRAIDWLMSLGVKSFTLPMCGSSIGSLDRPFAQVHMPKLHEFFHYRNIDVSTLKELCKMHNPELYEKLESSWVAPIKAHRVLKDCEDSISEYNFYRENFLFCS